MSECLYVFFWSLLCDYFVLNQENECDINMCVCVVVGVVFLIVNLIVGNDHVTSSWCLSVGSLNKE